MNIKAIVMVFCVLLFATGCYEFQKSVEEEEERNVNEISNFQECVEQGNPVMESYPRMCEAEGETFVEDISKKEKCENLLGGTWLPEHSECEGISESSCSDLGGDFESCASACSHDEDAEVCVDVCVQVCSFDEDNSSKSSSDSSNADTDESTSSVEGSLDKRCTDLGGTWLPEHSECEGISESSCSDLGGDFESCASACRHDEDAEVCTKQCVFVCELSDKISHESGGKEKIEDVSDTNSFEEKCLNEGGDWLSEHNECEHVNKDFCEKTEGIYDSCASACRHDEDADMCIQVCVPVCGY